MGPASEDAEPRAEPPSAANSLDRAAAADGAGRASSTNPCGPRRRDAEVLTMECQARHLNLAVKPCKP